MEDEISMLWITIIITAACLIGSCTSIDAIKKRVSDLESRVNELEHRR